MYWVGIETVSGQDFRGAVTQFPLNKEGTPPQEACVNHEGLQTGAKRRPCIQTLKAAAPGRHSSGDTSHDEEEVLLACAQLFCNVFRDTTTCTTVATLQLAQHGCPKGGKILLRFPVTGGYSVKQNSLEQKVLNLKHKIMQEKPLVHPPTTKQAKALWK